MIRYFATHPNAATILFLMVVILGLAAWPNLRRETFPEIPPDEVQIRIVYPGAASAEVESALCLRVEEALTRVHDLAEVRCDAREGVGSITAQVAEGGDFDRFLNEIKTEVEGIDTFPEEVERPTIRQLGRVDFVASLALVAPVPESELKSLAEEYKLKLLALPEIARVEVKGFSERRLRVEVDPEILRRHGLSLTTLAEKIAQQSVDLPAGTIETTERELLIRYRDRRLTPATLRELVVIAAPRGGELRLGEIATISNQFEHPEEQSWFNGKRAAILDISKARTQDGLLAVERVKRFITDELVRAPAGVELSITRDVTSALADRIAMLVENGIQGLILVLLVVWLFFDLRFGWSIAMGLLVSVLGGLFWMAVLGQQINMITLVALLISLGVVMDDSVVIAENISAAHTRGMTPTGAAIYGVKRVSSGVTASFLTTVFVTVPLIFIHGKMGYVLQAFPLVLTFTLVMSLLEAYLIFPHHLAAALARPVGGGSSRLRSWLLAGFDRGQEWFCRAVVERALRWRYVTLGLVVAGLLMSLALVAGGVLKLRAFPDVEGDVMEARILLPQGTTLERTREVVERVIAGARTVDEEYRPRQPEGSTLVRNIGVYYNRNVDAYEQGPHLATVVVDLLSTEVRDAPLEEVIARWREVVGSLPDVVMLKFTKPVHGPAGRPLEIRLEGREWEELAAVSTAYLEWLHRQPGVKDLASDLRPGKPEVVMKLREGATALGVSAALVAGQVRAAFQGVTVDEVQVGNESHRIEARYDSPHRASLEELEELAIITATGRAVPLGVVAELHLERGWSRIHRIDGQRTVTILGEVVPGRGNVKELLGRLNRELLPRMAERYPGVTVDFAGEAKEGATTGLSIGRGFLMGIAGIYLLFCFQFRNFLEPWIILSVIPTGLIGAFWGHLLIGQELSMPSLMGLVSLSGIAVNNAILLAELIRERVMNGEDVGSAGAAAVRERFRSVFLTTFTTLFGLLPLLLERSPQAQILIPLATSLGFGLLATTILALIMVPAIYGVVGDFGRLPTRDELGGGDERP